MKHFILPICLITLFAFNPSDQKVIEAKDCKEYAGKKITVFGKVKSFAGPGYSTSIDYYVTTDSVENGLAVEVPIEVYSKSKKLQLNQTGKMIEVYGLIKLNHRLS
jgi:hypothetical protein